MLIIIIRNNPKTMKKERVRMEKQEEVCSKEQIYTYGRSVGGQQRTVLLRDRTVLCRLIFQALEMTCSMVFLLG
jgi:hypothetical protein